MSHIAIDARELRTSSGRYVERLIHYLQQIDHHNDYTILLTPKDYDGWHPANPRFSKAACPHKEFTLDEQTGYLRQLQRLKPDLVHFAFVQQPVLYRGSSVTTMHDLTTIRFRNPSKNPLVFTLKQQIYKGVNIWAAHKSLAVITPTEFVKQDVARFTRVRTDKITVTYEAADPITDSPETIAGLEDKQFIMYVGRPTPHKNLGRLIEAFQILKQKYPRLHLVLAGKKDVLYEQHEQAAREQGIHDVVFTGFISEGQLRWLYEHCQAYIFPSLSEGFGLPALEAMQHGAPVISSNATCLPEVSGQAALYFDPLDTQDIASKISLALDDQHLRQELINEGKRQAQKFSWERMAEQTLAVYQTALRSS